MNSISEYMQKPIEQERDPGGDCFDRLRQTRVFRDGGDFPWRNAKLAIGGAGLLGGRLAVESVRSGADVCIWDFDRGSIVNMATQIAQPGVPKVRTVVEKCSKIRTGSCLGFPTDIRHAGIGQLRECSLIGDCTDDPQLAWILTQISNGLGIPLVRCAVDGTGALDLGRVLCSHGGGDSACQLCSYSVSDLRGAKQRTPCLGQPPEGLPPTNAGGAIACVIAGMALLQAQRLVTGNDIALALGTELVIDLTHLQLHAVHLPRSEECLSAHRRWNIEDIDLSASQATASDLLRVAESRLGTSNTSVSGYLHPLNTMASCVCGASAWTVGTSWAMPPRCRACRQPMVWFETTQLSEFNREVAESLGILDQNLLQLGFPRLGAMFVFRAPGRRPVHAVLNTV